MEDRGMFLVSPLASFAIFLGNVHIYALNSLVLLSFSKTLSHSCLNSNETTNLIFYLPKTSWSEVEQNFLPVSFASQYNNLRVYEETETGLSAALRLANSASHRGCPPQTNRHRRCLLEGNNVDNIIKLNNHSQH